MSAGGAVLPDPVLLTVGHGTLTADALGALLRGAGVQAVVDVRAAPGSRRHPHVARTRLAAWLPEAGVSYRWEPRLGGWRRALPDSPNQGLAHPSFRGYADWMASEAFAAALDDLLEEAALRPTAAMCSEALWWRCHRRLLADAAVLVHGMAVAHLAHDGALTSHHPTDEATLAAPPGAARPVVRYPRRAPG